MSEPPTPPNTALQIVRENQSTEQVYVDFYSDRLCEYAWKKTKERASVELISAIIGGVLVAGVTSGFSWIGALNGVLTFLAILVAAFVIHLLLSPRALDKKQRREKEQLQSACVIQTGIIKKYTTDLETTNAKCQGLESQVNALQTERDSLKSELEKFTKYRLKFEIDEKRSLAYVHQEVGNFTIIQASIVMQLKNYESDSITMEDLEMGLSEILNNTSDCQEISTFIFGEPAFQLLSTFENQEFRGRRFDPGVSPWFRFRAWIEIIGGDLKPSDLNVKHSLRMTAINQAPLSASLYFDWSKAAEKPASCFLVLPHSLAAPKRDRIMTFDKADELKRLSEGFAFVTPASDKPD
ncbi:MAG TPA: hypothetical protein DC054_09145 [Blastocatellia bacterium]|nr:hypothetical protein [Blastocatellia bacterium]